MDPIGMAIVWFQKCYTSIATTETWNLRVLLASEDPNELFARFFKDAIWLRNFYASEVHQQKEVKTYGGFHSHGGTPNGWFIRDNPILEMDDLGVPLWLRNLHRSKRPDIFVATVWLVGDPSMPIGGSLGWSFCLKHAAMLIHLELMPRCFVVNGTSTIFVKNVCGFSKRGITYIPRKMSGNVYPIFFFHVLVGVSISHCGVQVSPLKDLSHFDGQEIPDGFWEPNGESYQPCSHNWMTGWWFGTCFIFPYIGNNHPNWLSYFSEGWPNHQPDDFETWTAQEIWKDPRGVWWVRKTALSQKSSQNDMQPFEWTRTPK